MGGWLTTELKLETRTLQEAGEVREANVEAWSQGVTSKDKVWRPKKKVDKGPVVTEDLEEAEQVDGDATMDDQFVEDTLILDDESDKTIEEGVSNAGPVEDGLVNLGEGEQPIDSRLPKPSASVTLVKPKEGVGKSQGLHPRKTSAFKSGGPKIKDVAISKVTSASAKKGVGGVGKTLKDRGR
ncbi:cobalt chelatase subunit [Corchorus capsularis]|uniref:Cobalt chelatase subunit n=1 Tax=Corchorus capsularis TaxID=210143 RepID=A0A1R3K036_COCAP|nr:cobalt chelatase subunit [Corchorus capsularis]